MVSTNNYFAFRPLLTTIFHAFRGPLWYVLWSSNEPRRNLPARLEWYLCLDGTSEGLIRQRFLRKGNAGNAMLNQGIRALITKLLETGANNLSLALKKQAIRTNDEPAYVENAAP